MAKDSSFDVVSQVDMQEMDNAVNQTKKEIAQRYDFRGSDATRHSAALPGTGKG